MTISNTVKRRGLLPILLVSVSGMLVSCAVGPNYERPELKVPTAFKRASGAETNDSALANNWWTLFNDPALTRLAEDTLAANLDIRAAIARVEQARQGRRAALGNFAPFVDLGASARRSGNNNGTSEQFSLPLDLSYEFDLWGRLRRQYESFKASEAGSAADLAFVGQTAVAEVAQAYFTIRLYDRQILSFEQALDLYRKQLELTETKYRAGLALPTDLLQAKTQVNSSMSQLIEVRRSRAKQEHTIAILLALPPSDFSFAPAPLDVSVPTVPAGIPMSLLTRRPDVAEAEYRLVAANAEIGIATADFFPRFSLSGSAGFQSSNISNLLDWERRVWSIGPSLSLPIFQGGRLRAALAQARARYEELVAGYRLTVLNAFGEVEDQLSDLHLLEERAKALEETLVSAREYSRLTELQYRQGLTTYLQVIDANQTLLSNELSAAQAHSQRLIATILLMRALGGGWQNEYPAPVQP